MITKDFTIQNTSGLDWLLVVSLPVDLPMRRQICLGVQVVPGTLRRDPSTEKGGILSRDLPARNRNVRVHRGVGLRHT